MMSRPSGVTWRLGREQRPMNQPQVQALRSTMLRGMPWWLGTLYNRTKERPDWDG
jgi:hypothetical protein